MDRLNRLVVLLNTMRWVLAHLLRDPITWLTALTVASIWPLIAALAPLGLTTADRSPTAQLYEISYWALLVGTLGGLGVMARGRWFLIPLSAARRAAVEGVGLLTSALAYLGFTLMTAAALGAPIHLPLLAAALLSAMHLAVVGLLLLRAPGPPIGRALALPLLVWALPALLSAAAPPGPALARVLAASEHLAFPSPGDPAPAHRWVAVLPIIGLALAATLMRRPDAIRRPG